MQEAARAVLRSVPNAHGGVIVPPDALPEGPAAFGRLLASSLQRWREQGARVAWLEMPAARAELIGAAVALGFRFHHSQPDLLVLVRQLLPGARVPTAATHTIGVGGLVLTDGLELLVVLERRDLLSRPGHYKLPGGMLEPGEHLADGVVREVREETGIRTRCLGLLSLRHHHRGQFHDSNVYAVMLLRPLSFAITRDPEEIGSARWLAVGDYLASDAVGVYNQRLVRAALRFAPLSSIKLDGYLDDPNAYEVFLPE